MFESLEDQLKRLRLRAETTRKLVERSHPQVISSTLVPPTMEEDVWRDKVLDTLRRFMRPSEVGRAYEWLTSLKTLREFGQVSAPFERFILGAKDLTLDEFQRELRRFGVAERGGVREGERSVEKRDEKKVERRDEEVREKLEEKLEEKLVEKVIDRSRESLAKMTVKDLQRLAKELGAVPYSHLNKAELVEHLSGHKKQPSRPQLAFDPKMLAASKEGLRSNPTRRSERLAKPVKTEPTLLDELSSKIKARREASNEDDEWGNGLREGLREIGLRNPALVMGAIKAGNNNPILASTLQKLLRKL